MTVETFTNILRQMKPDTPVIIETLNGERQILENGTNCVDGDEWQTVIKTTKTEADAIAEFDTWMKSF